MDVKTVGDELLEEAKEAKKAFLKKSSISIAIKKNEIAKIKKTIEIAEAKPVEEFIACIKPEEELYDWDNIIEI